MSDTEAAAPVNDQMDQVELPVDSDEDMQPKLRNLLDSLNQSCATARNGWLFLLSVLAYLFITALSITHKDLFFDTAVKLPLLGAEVPLSRYFKYAPMGLLLFWLGILLQHWFLFDKLISFDKRIKLATAAQAEDGRCNTNADTLRNELSTYFFAQRVAGPQSILIRRGLVELLFWISFIVGPLFVLLQLQITFLPFHDELITFLHQCFVICGLLISFLTIRITSSNRWVPLRTLLSSGASITLFFSLFVATVPDSALERFTSSWPYGKVLVPFGKTTAHYRTGVERYAFLPTAYIFEGTYDELNRRPTSWSSRNLILPGVAPPKEVLGDDGTLRVSFRDRDLKYAVLDGVTLLGADFTGADLSGSSFRRANLRRTRFECADRGEPPPQLIAAMKSIWKARGESANSPPEDTWESAGQRRRCSNLFAANLEGADISYGRFSGANLRLAIANGVLARGATFEDANLNRASLYRADLAGVDARQSSLIGAGLAESRAELAIFDDADLTMAHLAYAGWSGASLARTSLRLVQAQGVNLTGASLEEAVLIGASLRQASIPNESAGPSEIRTARLVDATGARASKCDETWRQALIDRSNAIEVTKDPDDIRLGHRIRSMAGNAAATGRDKAGISNGVKEQSEERGGTAPNREAMWTRLIAASQRGIRGDANDDYRGRVSSYLAQLTCLDALLLDVAIANYGYDDYGWGDGWSNYDDSVALLENNLVDMPDIEMKIGDIDFAASAGKPSFINPVRIDVLNGAPELLSAVRDDACQSARSLKVTDPQLWCRYVKILLGEIKDRPETPRGQTELEPFCRPFVE